MKLKEIARSIRKHKDFIILTHYSADGDAIGSSFALLLALQKCGKTGCVILEEKISKIYSFLPAEKVFCIKDKPYTGNTDGKIVITIDCGDISRLGMRKIIFDKAEWTINLDHHPTNQSYGDLNYVDPSYSSCGEIIYELIKELGIVLDKDIAMCLYVAIITDTGGFKHSNTNCRTHLITAGLLEHDIDTSYIAMQVFDKMTKPKVMLIKRALGNLCFYLDSRVSVMTVSMKDFEETCADDEDTEGLVEIARNIEDVEVAVFIRETGIGSYRVNLRSNSDADVSEVAAVMGGGGHKKAAGCSFKGDMTENLDKILSEISKRI